MYGIRALSRIIGLPVLVLAVTAMAVPAATAQDRPTGVAQVKAGKRVLLNADGTLTVVARLECDPGWISSDLTVSVAQGLSTGTDGLIEPSVPCDGRWHRVQFGLPARWPARSSQVRRPSAPSFSCSTLRPGTRLQVMKRPLFTCIVRVISISGGRK